MDKKALLYVRPEMVERARDALRRAGYTAVFSAQSIEEGLAVFSREKPKLIVTHGMVNDYGDGYAFLHRVEAQDRGRVNPAALFISVDVRAVPWDFALDRNLAETLADLG